MLELERARTKHAKYCEKVKASSRKIRNISKKLEKRFRHLSETVSAIPTPQGRTPAATRIDMERAVSTPTSLTMPMSTHSSAVSRKDLRQPLEDQTTHFHVVQHQQHAPPESHSSSRPPSSTSIRLASHDGRTTIASSNVVETLTNINADVRPKVFRRKARNMVTYTPIAGADMKEVLVTSSLEGTIDFWDLADREVITSIPQSSLNQPWSEVICWVGKNVLAVASAHSNKHPLNHQLALVHVNKPRTRSALGHARAGFTWKVQTLKEMPHNAISVHMSGIGCIAPVSDDTNEMLFATGGMDKQIFAWRFSHKNNDDECVPISQQVIHSKHTSSIQALCYSPHNHTLYSGGADRKLIGWDMERSKVVVEHKNSGNRINSIEQSPVDPHLFLISEAAASHQLSLHDNRQRFGEPVLRFGSNGADSLSKQIVPSWHPGGSVISCGMQSETKINIWDIRWKDVQRGAGQSIDVHESRVYKAAFHPTQSSMISMSSNQLAFM
ncbi:hypothetical protein BGZ54_006923 [Gamsiella multidivaricata]|nr:hypothetical protein BGZ54_006923 [Gamsiella multidivaricata]